MMKKITAISLGLIVGLSSIGAYAADAELEVLQEGTQTVVLKGCLGEENADIGVTAQVFAKGYDFDDLKDIPDGMTIFDLIKYHDETVTDSEGNYEFKFDITSESQWITPYVSTKNVKVGGEDYDYMFVNDAEWRSVAKAINEAASRSDVLEELNESSLVLGFSAADMEEIEKSGLAEVILNTVDDEKLDADNRDTSWVLLKQALMVQRLNEGKIENIYDIDESLRELGDSDIAEYYDSDYVTEELEEDFTERLSDAGFESYNAYKDALAESFILATVRYPNGNDNIKTLFKDFESKIGIDYSDAKSHVWSSLSGGDYDSLEELAEAFSEENENPPKTSGGGGSGGGLGSNKKGTIGDFASGSIVSNQNQSLKPMSKSIFDDLGTVSWAEEAIVYLAEKQVINGVGNNKFDPNANITREQFAKIVMGAFMPDAEDKTTPFADVDAASWYAPFVGKAYGAGVITGMSENYFGVGGLLTRQDMCVMIYRAAAASGMEIKAEDYAEFADDALISDYAKEAVYSLREYGAVNGVNGSDFDPFGCATRAQAAKVIYSLVK